MQRLSSRLLCGLCMAPGQSAGRSMNSWNRETKNQAAPLPKVPAAPTPESSPTLPIKSVQRGNWPCQGADGAEGALSATGGIAIVIVPDAASFTGAAPTASMRQASPAPSQSPDANPEEAAVPAPDSQADGCQELAMDVMPQEDHMDFPSTIPASRPVSRKSQRPQPTAELAAALSNLSAAQLVDPIADLNIIREAALDARADLEPHLGAVVPLLLRAMRAPRLATARAAILTLKDLFASFGGTMCASVADDTSINSSLVLALMMKATGRDLNSKRIASDANTCLITMVEAVPPPACIFMLENYCTAKAHSRVRAKAAALVVGAAYRLAMTDIAAFDTALMTSLLKLCEPVLADGAAGRAAAWKLGVIVAHVYSTTHPEADDEAWSTFLRLRVEPETAQVINEAIEAHAASAAAAAAWSEGAGEDFQCFVVGQPLEEVLVHLIEDVGSDQ